MAEFRLETERLILREWREKDLGALHALCTDPQVMATIGPLNDEAATRGFLSRLQERQALYGCTFWAMERRSDSRVLGFCGISLGTVPHMESELEIGWRLASDCWGQSYAREGAQASIAWAGRERPGRDIWAITAVINSRSRGLMERLGMTRRTDLDFEHPSVPDGAPLKPHVTYVLPAISA